MSSDKTCGRQHLQVILGGGRAALCIWEAGVVRSTREARTLAAHGCTHAASAPSSEMRAFLRSYADDYERHCGPVAFELGRVCVADVPAEAHHLVGEIAGLAGDFGLSCLRPDGVVRVRLGVHDHLPLAAILALLGSGVVADARLRDDSWCLGLRYAADTFMATIRGVPIHGAAALRLLGFRAGRCGAWQQRFGAQTYATARSLVRVLQSCLPAPADLDAALAPCDALVPLRLPNLSVAEPVVGTAGDS